MIKRVSLVVCLMVALFGFSQKANTIPYHIDSTIIEQAKTHFGEKPFFIPEGMPEEIFYQNDIFLEVFENDSLLVSSMELKKKAPFHCLLYKEGDATIINGNFGFLAGYGFIVSLKENQATLQHTATSGGESIFSLQEGDSLVPALKIPTKKGKLILSRWPKVTPKDFTYGYVEFESGDYYKKDNTTTPAQLKKIKTIFKIYFKAKALIPEQVHEH